MEAPYEILVIGGSYLTKLQGLREVWEQDFSNPFGRPHFTFGALDGYKVAFLNRHGPGHILTPTEVNYAANIYAAKALGVTTVVSVCAVGSLQPGIDPGHLGLVSDYRDHTKYRRRNTFFGNGMVAHISPVPAYCPEAFRVTAEVARKVLPAGTFHEGGTEIVMEGPAFSFQAASFLNQAHGGQYIGMTALPEAILAMEAELCHITLAVVTDWDAWKIGRAVNVTDVGRVFAENGPKVQKLIRKLIPALSARPRHCPCHLRLQHAVQTGLEYITPEARLRLKPIIRRQLRRMQRKNRR